MDETNQISVNLGAKNRATITSTDKEWPLSNPVYAINWFDTKSLPLYNLYNRLASRSVRAVDGRPHFKGKVTRVLYGDDEDRRDVLLIVNYPSPQCFLNMLTSTYFMIVSILRMLAVKRFTFGFTRSRSDSATEKDPRFEQAYLVHLYRGDNISEEVLAISTRAGARVLYNGTLSARVSTGSAGAKKQNIQCLMDGIVVLQAKDSSVFDKMAMSEEYQSVVQKTDSSFVAHIDRLI